VRSRCAALALVPSLIGCNLIFNFSGFDSEYGVDCATDAATDAAADATKPVTCDAAALGSDPRNCGSCGHGCLGGICMAMQCQPFTLAPVDQGTMTTPIALDPDHVYWSDVPGIMSVLKDGGSLRTVAPLPSHAGVNDIAVDPSGVYWSTGGGIFRHTDAGTTSLWAGESTSLALDPTYVYWTTLSLAVVLSAEKGHTSDVDVLVSSAKDESYLVENLLVFHDYLYWTDADDWPNVQKVSTGGCLNGPSDCGTPLAPDGAAHPNGLVVDDGGIFWSTSGGLQQAAPDAGEPTQLYTPPGGGISALAADSEYFYIAIEKPGPRILRVSRASSKPELVANLLYNEAPLALAVDDVAIYFVSAGIEQGNVGMGDGGRVGAIAK
jgi:hypothetical protein